MLLGVPLLALVWANSLFAASYVEMWQTELRVGIGDLELANRFSSGSTSQATLWELEAVSQAAQTPLQHLEHGLHPWVAFASGPARLVAVAALLPPGPLHLMVFVQG